MSKRVGKNYNSAWIERMAEKPIAFNPAWARLVGSATAGLFLSQLLYWWKKGIDREWIYKTIREFEDETVLNRSEQDRAIKIWKNLGVIIVEKRGIPPKRHFHINTLRLEQLVHEHKGTDLLISANQSAKQGGTSCSREQNTTESTQENTSKDLVLHTFAARNSFDIDAAREVLSKKFSIKKDQ